MERAALPSHGSWLQSMEQLPKWPLIRPNLGAPPCSQAWLVLLPFWCQLESPVLLPYYKPQRGGSRRDNCKYSQTHPLYREKKITNAVAQSAAIFVSAATGPPHNTLLMLQPHGIKLVNPLWGSVCGQPLSEDKTLLSCTNQSSTWFVSQRGAHWR